MSIVDVEDVAIAHLRAILVEKAGGHRIILSAESMWISDIAKTLNDEFYSIPHVESNLLYVKLASFFSEEAQQVLDAWGKELVFDTSKSREILGIEYGDPRQALIATVKSMIQTGLLEDRSSRGRLKRRLSPTRVT